MVSGMAHPQVECDKRVRREIANSNERRRMQSINAGFDQLKVLLPPIQDGDKLSKATILQLTAKYIGALKYRIAALENKVSSYENQDGPAAVLSELHIDSALRKRKINDKRSSEIQRVRKSKRASSASDQEMCPLSTAELDAASAELERQVEQAGSGGVLLAQSNMEPLSPLSPSSQESPPHSESDSSTTARLEHLVMAIEQIEGGLQPSSSAGNSNQQRPQLPHVGPRAAKGRGNHCNTKKEEEEEEEEEEELVYPQSASCAPVLKPSISPFAQEAMLLDQQQQQQRPSGKHPIVTRILSNRGAIPHKYLHRPQVVASGSNAGGDD